MNLAIPSYVGPEGPKAPVCSVALRVYVWRQDRIWDKIRVQHPCSLVRLEAFSGFVDLSLSDFCPGHPGISHSYAVLTWRAQG